MSGKVKDRANGRKAPAVPPEVAAAVTAALEAHGDTADALIPVLSAVNRALGYLSPEALAEVGRRLRTPDSQVHGVATFYTMLSTRPRGRHLVQFCENAPCHVVGGRQVWRGLRQALGLAPGETSPDGRFTLVTTSCIGACAVGPVVVIDDDVHGNVAPDQIDALLARYP
jgi:NADH:ubiquinone oxidoreductase subunit E